MRERKIRENKAKKPINCGMPKSRKENVYTTKEKKNNKQDDLLVD